MSLLEERSIKEASLWFIFFPPTKPKHRSFDSPNRQIDTIFYPELQVSPSSFGGQLKHCVSIKRFVLILLENNNGDADADEDDQFFSS